MRRHAMFTRVPHSIMPFLPADGRHATFCRQPRARFRDSRQSFAEICDDATDRRRYVF